MDKPNPLCHELFAPWGRPDDEQGSARLLRKSLAQDAPRTALVDQLNAALRRPETKNP